MNNMKSFLSLALLLFLSISGMKNCFAQTKTGIKSVKEISIDNKDKETAKSFQSFDTKGNLIEEIEYEDDGKVKDRVTYEYNAENLKIKETHFTPDNKTDEVTTYQYDAKGNRISKMVVDGNGKLKSKKKFVYEYY